jgi:hypothetical protein
VFVAPLQPLVAFRAVAAGAPVEYWDLPSELAEQSDGPEFTEADVATFRDLLEQPDWFDQFAARDDPSQ